MCICSMSRVLGHHHLLNLHFYICLYREVCGYVYVYRYMCIYFYLHISYIDTFCGSYMFKSPYPQFFTPHHQEAAMRWIQSPCGHLQIPAISRCLKWGRPVLSLWICCTYEKIMAMVLDIIFQENNGKPCPG